MTLSERFTAAQAEIMATNPGIHRHRAQFLAEQELTTDERTQLHTEREREAQQWLARRSRERQPRAPQHMIDIHIRNGWDID